MKAGRDRVGSSDRLALTSETSGRYYSRVPKAFQVLFIIFYLFGDFCITATLIPSLASV